MGLPRSPEQDARPPMAESPSVRIPDPDPPTVEVEGGHADPLSVAAFLCYIAPIPLGQFLCQTSQLIREGSRVTPVETEEKAKQH
jgi:hypothetical protein